MRIALFSDIHGKILLPFKLCDLYQRETGKQLDIILQCGDIGAYPNLDNLDKATVKHAKYDRDELGFYDDFTIINSEIHSFLEELNLDMICVRGNHEDHEYLNTLEKQFPDKSKFPIDIYKRVWVCKSGEIQEFKTSDKTLRFVGVGRIGDRKGRLEQRFIQVYEKEKINQLLNSKLDFDLLLSHDKDDSSQRGYGMSEIRSLLDHVIFHYHFYGHTGEPYKMLLDDNGITMSCKIKELEFGDDGLLSEGCMIVLEKIDDEKFHVEVVSQTLINKLTKNNWKL